MSETMTAELKDKLAQFDPSKPLVIKTTEIEGLEHLTGRFVFRRQNVQDRLRVGVLAAKHREGMELDSMTDNIAFILSTFSVVTVEKPANFEFGSLFDVGPLFVLWERYSEWLELFRLQLQFSKTNGSGADE